MNLINNHYLIFQSFYPKLYKSTTKSWPAGLGFPKGEPTYLMNKTCLTFYKLVKSRNKYYKIQLIGEIAGTPFLSLARLHLFRCSYVQTTRTKLLEKKFRPMHKEINKLLWGLLVILSLKSLELPLQTFRVTIFG